MCVFIFVSFNFFLTMGPYRFQSRWLTRNENGIGLINIDGGMLSDIVLWHGTSGGLTEIVFTHGSTQIWRFY